MTTYDRIGSMAAAALLAGCLVLGGCGQGGNPGGPPKGGPPEVAVVTMATQRLPLTSELAGRTSASLVAEVRPQVGGLIQKRLFTEGADVEAGQTLYQIDPATYQAALENARAALGRSEANLSAVRLRAQRLRDLLADKAVSQQDSDDAEAALKQNEADIRYWKAAVETARINLQYTTVTAPISGRIGRSNVTEGALVTAHQPLALAVIQRLDPMYVDVPQSTADLLRLRRRLEAGRLRQNREVRNKVRLIQEDGVAYPLEGTLQFQDVTVDATTGSVMVRLIFPNPRGLLLPGMFVRAVVSEGVNEAAILLPQQAVSQDTKGNPVVLVVDAQGKVEQRRVVLDRAVDDKWLVVSGLTAGERVVVEGIQKARPGSLVKAVPFVPAGGAPAAPPPAAAGKKP